MLSRGSRGSRREPSTAPALVQLPDPSNLFNAGLDGNKWRAIDIRKGDKIDEIALKALLRGAAVYNTKHSVPKSKGS